MNRAVRLYDPERLGAHPRKRFRLPKFLRDDEYTALLAYLDSQIEVAANRRFRSGQFVRMARRDRLLVYLGLFAGLRVAEICSLVIEEIDFAAKSIRVIGKGDKERILPMHPKLEPLLRDWIGERKTGWVFLGLFGRHLATGTVRLRYAETIARGVKTHCKLRPHVMRHSACTRMLSRGADIKAVQEFAGHASLASTNLYVHCTPERLREAVERL